MRKNTIFLILLVSLSCTRDIQSPQSQLSFDSMSLKKSGALAAFPATSNICFGVNVHAEDLPNQSPNTCTPPISRHTGFVSSGLPISIDVPKGEKRVVTAYAYVGDTLATPCPAWGVGLDYSKVYKVAVSEELDLTNPTQEVKLTPVFPGIGSDLKSQLSLQTGCELPTGPKSCDHDLAGADFVPSNGDILSGSYCNIGEFKIENGDTVSIASLSEVTIKANNITIQGTIDGNGKGYGDGQGPGGGTVNGHGGSHAGPGGGGVAAGLFVSYADAPAEFGSGGYGGTGGNGGGKIIFDAASTFDISGSGSVSMNGVTPSACGVNGGAGSGGSIIIHADTITGFNSISATGGAPCAGGGGGSGGRIAVHYKNMSGSPFFNVGQEYISGPPPSSVFGSPGSLYMNDLANGTNFVEYKGSYDSDSVPNFSTFGVVQQLKIGNYVGLSASGPGEITSPLTISGGTLKLTGTANISVPLIMTNGAIEIDNTAHIDDLTVSGGSILLKSTTSSFGDLIMNGGTITHEQNDTVHLYSAKIVANNFSLNAGATIDLKSKGFMSEKGPGGVVGANKGGTHYGSGGGNGSGTYGSSTVPNTIGSGGYGSTGYGNATYRKQGAGGGHARIEVSGLLNVDGTINANATDMGCCINFSGGSGGSIYISAATFSGSGNITANGGAKTGSGGGNGGGGGMVAYYYTNSTFSGTITANGGAGGVAGGAGSVHDGGLTSYPGP